MDKIFRTLIVISYLSYLLWFFQPYYETSLLTDLMREMLDADGYNGYDFFLKNSKVIGWFFLVAYLAASIGLYFYLRSARTLFTLLFCTSFVLPIFFGMSVQSHIDVILNNIVGFADAIILYMCYLSPIANNFTMHNNAFKRVAEKAPRSLT